jgi:mono/diheme cytochrome c family protein
MAKLKILVSLIMMVSSLSAISQTKPWPGSPEDAAKVNPVAIELKNLGIGRSIFARSCVACHGAKADGKGLIQSANLIDPVFQKQSDGAIFYKINTGRDKMPPFRSMLKEDEIWSVINYLRVLVNRLALPPTKDVKIELTTGDEIKSITAFVHSTGPTILPFQEVDVNFYIKRNLGLMRIGKSSNLTGIDGKVKVIFPEKIVGDEDGNVTLIVKVENSFLYNNAELEIVRRWGSPLKTYDENFNQRTLWGSRDKSPVWLLLLANGIIAGIWGVIFYVIYNLFRIKKAGKIFIKD